MKKRNVQAVLEIIKTRRSCRLFTEETVPEQDLLAIMEAGNCAPSPMNTQPWEFIVLTGDALARYRITVLEWLKPSNANPGPYDEGGTFDETEIGSAVLPRHLLERKKAHVRRLMDHLAGMGLKLKDVYNSTYFGHNAPAIILVIGDVVNREHRRGLEVHQSIAAAMQNMLLAVHAMGYGACWIGDMMKFGERLHRYLDLPAGKELVGGITVGRPMENLDLKGVPKIPVTEKISWRIQ